MSPSPPTFASQDERSLRLAAFPLTRGLLDAWLNHQKAWLKAAREITSSGGPADLAAVDNAAAQAVSIDPATRAAVEALCRAFCAERSTLHELRRRRAGAETAGLSPEQRRRLDEVLEKEQAKLAQLGRRYGQEAIDLLLSREEEVLPLYQEREHVLRRMPLTADRD